MTESIYPDWLLRFIIFKFALNAFNIDMDSYVRFLETYFPIFLISFEKKIKDSSCL